MPLIYSVLCSVSFLSPCPNRASSPHHWFPQSFALSLFSLVVLTRPSFPHSDRFRTMINVLGDSVGAGLVYELSKKELEQLNINANGDVDRPSNEIGMDAVESSKMWEEERVNEAQLNVQFTTSSNQTPVTSAPAAARDPTQCRREGESQPQPQQSSSLQHETLL